MKNNKNKGDRTPISKGGIVDQEIVYSPSLEFLQGLFSVFVIIFIIEHFQKEKAGDFAPAFCLRYK